jgi:predicted small lipoprotein YifL
MAYSVSALTDIDPRMKHRQNPAPSRIAQLALGGLLAAVLALAGLACGQRGPLFLPDEAAPVETAAPDADDEENDSDATTPRT